MVAENEHVDEHLRGPLTTEAKRELVERLFAAFNSFDLESVLSLLHSNCSYRVIVSGKVLASGEDHSAIKTLLFEEGKSSSSRKKTILECFTRGEQLILEMSYSRVLAVSEGRKKVGDIEHSSGIAEVRFQNQKIIEYVEMYSG